MKPKPLLLLAGLLLTGTTDASEDDFTRYIEAARAARVERLVHPDGWLALIGRHELKPGANTVGRAGDNRIVLAAGPARFGTVTLAPDGRVTFAPAIEAVVLVDGEPAPAVAELRPGSARDRPTQVTAGTVGISLIDFGGSKALRARDVAAARLTDFPGIEYFPADLSWRIEAEWVPFTQPRHLPITNIAGGVSRELVPGQAVFQRDGQTFVLLPTANADGSLFFIISDATSDAETYHMRYLQAPPPREGRVLLDFNLTQNPPCAFSPVAVCPLPPKENHLPFPVRAGERIFHGVEPGSR